MENLTQMSIQSGLFFQNQNTFYDFQKRAGKASHTPPKLRACVYQYRLFSLNHMFRNLSQPGNVL